MRVAEVALLAVWIALPGPGSAAAATLFERLGGEPGVEAIAATLIDRVAADRALGRSFKDTNLGRIKQHLAEQICTLAAGPCRYSGDEMREVHAGHDISEADFYGMVAMLESVLRERGVGLADRNRLLARLAPLKRDVVRIPAGAE